MAAPRKAIVVGISGCSSSGKTTLSRLLRDIFPNTFVLHQDDFYREEKELPTKNGLLDWDCAEALSIPGMIKSLTHIHNEGTFPTAQRSVLTCRSSQPDLDSKEDQNSIGACPVSDSAIAALKARVKTWIEPGNPGYRVLDSTRMCVLDGFLLYSKSMVEIQPQLDVKIFLRVSYAKAKERRERRTGYVTLEGFWEDPPGYVDKIVWPNYVEDHKWLFENGDVEGKVDEAVMREEGIRVLNAGEEGIKGLDVEMERTLEWVAELLMELLPGLVGKA